MVRSSSPRSKEKVLSSQLKEVFQEKGVPTKGGSISLTIKGMPLTTTLGKLPEKPTPKFTNECLNRLQLKMGASDNKMKIMGNFLRVNCGRDSVQNHEDFMKERNSKLEEFFDTKMVNTKKYVMEETIDESGRMKKKKS